MGKEKEEMKKRIIATVMAAVMAAGCIGCSSSNSANSTKEATEVSEVAKAEVSENEKQAVTDVADEGVTITFWHSMGGVNGEAVDYLVNKFNEENQEGITVVSEYQGSYDDAINKLKSAQLGNMGADLVQIYDIGTRFMIDSGWIIPMQDLIDKDGYDLSAIEANIAAYYTVDDKLYSMPFNSSTPILYYNKDMFDKAGITEIPTSFGEIEAISEQLMTKGEAGEAMALGIYGWFFEQFVCKQQQNYVDNGNGRKAVAGAVEFDSNGAGLNILNAWKSLYDKGYAPNVGDDDSAIADFTAGKAAITLGSTASLKQILNDVNGAFEVGTAYFPKVNDTDKGGVSIGGGSLWALDNNDEKKAQATWEFIKFLVSAPSQAYWNAQTGYFPVTTAAHEEAVFKENVEKYPQFMTAIDQLHDSSAESAGALLSVFPEARQTVEAEIENMLNGKETAKEAVDAMAKQINKAIEEYNLLNE